MIKIILIKIVIVLSKICDVINKCKYYVIKFKKNKNRFKISFEVKFKNELFNILQLHIVQSVLIYITSCSTENFIFISDMFCKNDLS